MYSEAGIDRLGAYAESQTSVADTRLKDTSFMLIVQRMVDESILAWRAEQAGKSATDVSFDVGLTPFPRMRDPKQQNIGSRIGPIFINLAFTVPAMILIIRVVREKERHVTGAMRSTGLLDSAYWVSYWLQGIFIAIVVTLLAYLAGLILGLQVFTKADGSVVYTMLFVYELAWFAIAFAIASCFHSVQSAIICSVFFLLVTVLFSAFSFFPVANYVWWEKNIPSALPGLFSALFPWFNVVKFLADATEVTNTQAALNLTTGLNDVTEGSNFGWSEMYNYTVNRTAFLSYNQIKDDLDKSWFMSPVPGESFNFLFLNLGIYFWLAWYLSQVLTGGESRPQPLYFPFYPRYWLTFKDGGSGVRHLKAQLRRVTEDRVAGLDSDVADEMRAVHMESLPVDTTVTLHGLVKRYRPNVSLPCSSTTWFTAVKGVSYSMQKGKLFALLGHNGAGKTTTIKMVTAQENPSEGDTLIHGLSIATEAHKIRKFLGMCPQHDILYNEFTASEHLWLYGRLKGLPKAMLEKQVPELIKAVKLERVTHKQAGTYSGGMKRRLSVAISFIGDPKVVMLDEPTTGMDPMNRKHVWDMIAELKQERTVLLTTHSMEEADALGDRIGIMSAGQLVALGNSLHLKDKFGDGYTVKVVAPTVSVAALKMKIDEVLPAAKLADENSGNMTYILPDAETIAQAPKLISLIESVQKGEVPGERCIHASALQLLTALLLLNILPQR